MDLSIKTMIKFKRKEFAISHRYYIPHRPEIATYGNSSIQPTPVTTQDGQSIVPTGQQVILQQPAKDANMMVSLGKVGLIGAGTLGTAGLVEGGRSVYNAYKGVTGAKEVANLLKNNPELLEKIQKSTAESIASKGASFIPSSLTNLASKYRIKSEDLTKLAETYLKKPAETAVNSGKAAIKGGFEFYKGLEKSPISKAVLLGKAWNKLASMPRIVLLNAGRLTEGGTNAILNNMSGVTSAEKATLSKVPGVIDRFARSGLHLKNSRGLLLGATGLASLGGYFYTNGRGLQSPIPATVATPITPKQNTPPTSY